MQSIWDHPEDARVKLVSESVRGTKGLQRCYAFRDMDSVCVCVCVCVCLFMCVIVSLFVVG